MSTSIDESKITAFALGDLDGDERAEVERAVALDPDLAARVEAIRLAAASIERGFQAEPLPEPPACPAGAPARPHRVAPRWSLWMTGAAAAASALLAILLPTDMARPGARPPRDASANLDALGTYVVMYVSQQGSDRAYPGMARPDGLTAPDQSGLFVARVYGTAPSPDGIDFRFQQLQTYANPGKGEKQDLLQGETAIQSKRDVHGPGSSSVVGGCATLAPPELTEDTLHGAVSSLSSLKAAIRGPRPQAGGWAGLPPGAQGPEVGQNTEGYEHIVENPFLTSIESPLSTFSIDVDTASYSNVRRFLTGGQLPPPDAVRIEELINYFTYDYAPPTDDRPFAVHMEMASCPWKPDHKLLRIGLKGRTLEKRPPSNLVFLIDVSGSMQATNKLPLVQRSLDLLVNQLTENDRVSIVVYAGASGLVLSPTTGDKKARILDAIERLSAGGSTNGGAGIELAYSLATQNFVQGGTNRVVLATDGDWNVGVTNQGDLTRLIEEKAKSGVFLSVLGFGMGNLKDDTLERLADKGNGNYAYVDSLSEARKVLVERMTGTLCTIAKDVKLQVEFNPARIAGYRLIGYENRLLAKEDFKDDKKDAGEIGAGHTVTALYELVPAGQEVPGGTPPVDPLKYQTPSEPAGASLDICTVKLRYKAPEAAESTLMEVPLKQGRDRFDDASADFRFAAAVAGYGMLLRRSEYAKGFTWEALTEIASGALGEDREGYRKELLDLARRAKDLSGK